MNQPWDTLSVLMLHIGLQAGGSPSVSCFIAGEHHSSTNCPTNLVDTRDPVITKNDTASVSLFCYGQVHIV